LRPDGLSSGSDRKTTRDAVGTALQQLESLAGQLRCHTRDARHVTALSRQPRNVVEGIACVHDERGPLYEILADTRISRTRCKDHINANPFELRQELRQSLVVPVCPPRLKRDVLPLDVATLCELSLEDCVGRYGGQLRRCRLKTHPAKPIHLASFLGRHAGDCVRAASTSVRSSTTMRTDMSSSSGNGWRGV
jgi:hypothetical protein